MGIFQKVGKSSHFLPRILLYKKFPDVRTQDMKKCDKKPQDIVFWQCIYWEKQSKNVQSAQKTKRKFS